MSTEFNYQTSFILDKSHFIECFDQSISEQTLWAKYRNVVILAVVGLLLLFVVGTNHYAAFFVVALAAIEALSIYYKKTWWLWRQMLSKAYNHTVGLMVNDEGIKIKSFHVNSDMKFENITQCDEKESGLLITHLKSLNYVSKSCLSDEAIEFIKVKSNK